MALMRLQTTASPEEELLQVYVRARAITYPIFQCLVCLCKIMPIKCQSSCIPKHSYMHNHASYVFMHLIKLLCYSYASAFSIPMLISIKTNRVNFKFLLLTTNVYCHVNFNSFVNIPVKYKLLQLYQSNSIPFQIQIVSVIGQVASSHPRTACTYSFDTRRATSSGPRTARAFYVVSCQPSN